MSIFGFLIVKLTSSELAAFVIRCVYSFGFVGFTATYSTVNAGLLGLFHVLVSLFCFSIYVNKIILLSKFQDFKSLHSLYSQLSLLIGHFNELYSYRIFVRSIFPVLPVPFLSFYVIIKFHSEFNVISILVPFSMVIFVYPVLEMVLLMAANVWVKCIHFLEHVKSHVVVKRHTSFQTRKLRAMRPLQIKVGKSNFIESQTPFVFISYNLSQMSSLLSIGIH